MTYQELCNLIDGSKQPEPAFEKLPMGDPEDCYIWGEGEFARVQMEMRRDEILASGNITQELISELAEIEVALCKF